VLLASSAGDKKGGDRPAFAFDVKAVDDTDRIEAAFRDRKATLEMANVLPFSKWPTNLTKEQEKLKEKGLAFLKNHLKGKYIAITGIDKGKVFRGDLVLSGSGYFTAGPSTLGWGIVQVNCLLIEEGYTVYKKDPPEWWFDQKNLGVLKKGRAALYEEAEAYAKKKKNGIWQDEDLAKKLQALSKPPELKK
jgi:endonuclease YncB( thermonuclease family)